MWALYVLSTLAHVAFCLGAARRCARSCRDLVGRRSDRRRLGTRGHLLEHLPRSPGPPWPALLIALVRADRDLSASTSGTFARLARGALAAAAAPRAADADRPGACARSSRVFATSVRPAASLLGIVPGRLERDDLRHAEGALPGARAESFGGGARIVGFLYAAPVRRRAPARSLLSGWTSHVRRQGLAVAVAAGSGESRSSLFGFADVLLARARAARGGRRGRQRSAPSCAARSS